MTIEAEVGLIVSFMCILGFLFKILVYIVTNMIKPLSLNIEQLEKATIEINTLCTSIKENLHDLDKRITLTEAMAKAAHRRLDEHIAEHANLK